MQEEKHKRLLEIKLWVWAQGWAHASMHPRKKLSPEKGAVALVGKENMKKQLIGLIHLLVVHKLIQTSREKWIISYLSILYRKIYIQA